MGQWMIVLQVIVGPMLALFAKSTVTLSRERRARHRIHETAELVQSLPDESRAPLVGLLDDQIRRFVQDQRRQLHRKVDSGTVAALVFVGLVGGLAIAGGLAAGHWWWISLGSLVALTCLLLSIVGLGQLFTYEDPAAEATAGSGH